MIIGIISMLIEMRIRAGMIIGVHPITIITIRNTITALIIGIIEIIIIITITGIMCKCKMYKLNSLSLISETHHLFDIWMSLKSLKNIKYLLKHSLSQLRSSTLLPIPFIHAPILEIFLAKK